MNTAEQNVSRMGSEHDRESSGSLSALTALRNSVRFLSDIQQLVECPLPVPPVSPPKSLNEGGFLLDGIIAYLSRKHGGNVHHNGIVEITSKSVNSADPREAVWNIADLTKDSLFRSADAPKQWIRWNFHNLLVLPTHYTIRSWNLRSWVIESSLDGENWTIIDEQTNNKDLYDNPSIKSFPVSSSTKCHFIRLSQTGKNNGRCDFLLLHAFEVFGALVEQQE
jgi:hypothetical protein